jgi:tetratricopeptide (TPR) repeat protein
VNKRSVDPLVRDELRRTLLSSPGLLLFAFGALLLIGGCETEKHARFRQYQEDGIQHYQRGEFVAARDKFELALPLNPKDANLLYDLGQCQDRLAQTSEAEDYYKQCLTVNGNHADCRHALTLLLYRNGRRNEADSMIEAWMQSQPELSAAYAEDGWRLRQNGEFQLAMGRFQQALHYDSRNVRALTEMGIAYEENGQPERALTMYKRALEINPQLPGLSQHINELKTRGVSKPLPD